MPSTPLPAYLLTAPGREDILAGTLGRWAAAGGGAAPEVVLDPSPPGTRGLNRLFGGWRALLGRAAAEATASHVLLLEDDLDFAPGFAKRAAEWSPLAGGRVTGFGSLFNPGVPALPPEDGGEVGADFFLAEPRGVAGSQALVVARDFLRRVAADWDGLEGFAVMRFGGLAARLGLPVFYHRPSLVEHVGTVSTWGGFLRRAVDFEGKALD